MEFEYDRFFIGGEWVSPSSDATFDVVSASTEEVVGRVPAGADGDIDAAVDAARRAFDDPSGWAHWPAADRADAMERLAGVLERTGGEAARRTSIQNGMPISVAAMTEGVFPAVLLRYYAGLIRQTPLEDIRDGLLGGQIKVRRQPIGVIGAIVPWNYPQCLTAFKLGPALAMGCTMVIKPSPETTVDAYVLAEAVAEAGLPAGVVNIVQADRDAGSHLVSHRGIDKVAFTGSTGAGRSIAETCGRMLRPVTLELGGKSAAIVLDDADLGANLEGVFSATLLNNGQTCYLGTRVLAPRARYDEIVDTFAAFAGSLKVGDSLDPDTQIGPVATARQRERIEGYIAKGRSDGARVVAGGGRPSGHDRGFFVEPTIFADVDNASVIAQEEIFGPVLAIIAYDTVDDAVRIANDSDYGLGGSVWTSDPERGAAVAERVQTGSIGVNRYMTDPAAPFGGVKDSGLGRELGPEGLLAYQSLQSIYL